VPRALPILSVALATACACGAPAGPPPLGNVLVIVDTDAPVPKLATNLRVDLFTPDGTWYASRVVGAPTPAAWPVSFGLFVPDGANATQVVVRLRAYPEGKLRNYLGERYQPVPAGGKPLDIPPAIAPTAGGAPRLEDSHGTDVTPVFEPEPLVTIDRLLVVPLTPDRVGAVRVTLQGACFGTMADIRDFGALQTCADTQGQLVTPAPETLDLDRSLPAASQQGAFEAADAQPCTGTPRARTTGAGGTPLYDDDVCVGGGAFIFGSKDGAIGDVSDDVPERVALVPSFFMDRYEVTVGRVRAAIDRGFHAVTIFANDQTISSTNGETDLTVCTWSHAPIGREDMPVTCVDPATARAFCRFDGGDLPLEVQWEYAAAMSDRPARTPFPWGDGDGQPPACADAVYSRGDMNGFYECAMAGFPFGPASVASADHEGGDRSIGLGIVDLAGNVSEWTADAFASPAANCWAEAPIELPSCAVAGVDSAGRGGSWPFSWTELTTVTRGETYSPPDQQQSTTIGFRCVRPGSGS
jgi:sulfatase modifying factor 1